MIQKFAAIVVFLIFWLEKDTVAQPLQNADGSFNEVNEWFDAWELVWKASYKLKKIKPVEFLLFDDQFVYTNSKASGENGQPVKGPDLLNQEINWIKKEHNGSLTFPNGQKVSVQFFSFSSQTDEGVPFFVMPLVSFWKTQNSDDHGIGIKNFTTCVFLHEFAHTQQLQSLESVSVVLENYANEHPQDKISDDILQHYYGKDSVYVNSYLKEAALFNAAAFSSNAQERIGLTKEAISLLKTRQANCLKKDGRDIAMIDNFFLTLEGVGQFTAFLWLIHEDGFNMSEAEARKVLKTVWWSQEQGLDTAVLLSRFLKNSDFARLMFATKHTSIIELLDRESEH